MSIHEALSPDAIAAQDTLFTERLEGESRHIPIHELIVDHTYQRLPSQRRVAEMATRFDPLLLGRLFVSQRSDGSLAVIDGQHRLEMLRTLYPESDIAVPCIVYVGLSIEAEAELFWKMQKMRRSVSAAEQFVARLASNEDKAKRIFAAMTEANCRLISYQVGMHRMPFRSTRAIRAIEDVYDAIGAAGLVRTLTLLGDAWEDEPDVFRSEHVLGIGALLRQFPEIDDHRIVVKLRDASPSAVRRAANAYANEIDRGRGGKAFAKAVLALYNKGRRNDENRLAWEG